MLLQINATFIVAVVSFLIFLTIIKVILCRPIEKVIEERENFYAKNSRIEIESKEKSKNLIQNKENMIKDARLKAGELIKTTVDTVNKQGEEKIKETKLELQNIIENKRKELVLEKEIAKREMKEQMSNIVSQIVSKVLSQDIEINLDDEKINKYLKI